MSNATTVRALRSHAAGYVHDNHCPGDPGYCRPSLADWSLETLSPDQLANVFESPEAARLWFQSEVDMDREDEMHRDWHLLLIEPIRDEVVVLIRDGRAYIWDGWHRVAASIATGRAVAAIVGRPHL